ncbi:MAG: ribosome maturation factor RimM [Caulobacteraceae bacterium]
MTGAPKLVLVGRVAGAFGVKGEVRISAYTQTPLALLKYRDLRREDGSLGLTLISGRAAKTDFIGAVKEIATKEEADALRGLRLYVAREDMPPPEEDEFYLADLIGLEVVEDGKTIGKVKAVHNFGAGDILEIEPPRGPTWYLPFTRKAVPEVDIAGGRILAVRPGEVMGDPPQGESP